MKKYLFAVVLVPLLLCSACREGSPERAPGAGTAAQSATVPLTIPALPAEGVKENLQGGGWFTWKFAEKPKLGSVIVKVQAFNKDGSRNTACEIIGETGMPSMRAHDLSTGFVKNKKGDYLMPFDLVMPGEWQVVIRIKEGGKEIYAGQVLFNI
ncbi:MAG: hypothetical protein A3J79_04050 [Elusimicrobia bacterium RIFOXYB2_FULL_62_6]|nr:MAG: hypothetical protein A3J79_04050 [Elusimicrobia bacterium RIFOXYB2_FULL_62_6]